MKKLTVCLIALAMSIGFGLTAASAQGPWEAGDGYDPHYPYMYVDPGGIGDLLLFSLYDVRPVDGRGPLWENYIAIENTSGKWTAFHLRFRAWKKSIEVFDHVILLSPYDVFWMTLSLAQGSGITTYPCDDPVECPAGFEPYEAGDVLMYSGDKHTLYNSALIYENLGQTSWLDKFQDSLLVFNGFDSGPNGRAPKAELQAGYIEAIGLWQLSIPGEKDAEGNIVKDEDTHKLNEVVTNVHPDPAIPGVTLNVYDALDALFYRFFTSDGIKEASRTVNVPEAEGSPARWACQDANTFTGCWTKYPVSKTTGIDSAWPDFIPLNLTKANPGALVVPVKIERTVQPFYTGALVYVNESPTATRFGLDCANVLAGNVIMGDALNGKYQMENFIALRHFRTDADRVGNPENPFWTHIYYTTGYGDQARDCDLEDGNWIHRDGYQGGGIFFPASITDWYYKPGVVDIFTGGSAETYFWYYVNSTVTTAAGPTLVDGNDLAGLNYNDVQGHPNWNNPERGYYTSGGGDFYDFNRMVRNYGLTRPFPFNSLAIENDAYAYVHYYNDIWSLDDLEAALAKFQIWYTHLRTRVADGQKGNLDTDVVLTYPTKHNHFFFTDWPFMWQPYKAGYCPEDTVTLTHRVESPDVYQYWANLLEYRGSRIGDFEALVGSGYKGLKSIEKLIIFASRADDITEENFIAGQYNINNLTMAQWFENRWYNGRIYVNAYIWDNEQNRPDPDRPLPPPGSPWFPDPQPPKWAPHEVNIVRVGESTPTWPGSKPAGTINDLNWLLAAGKGTQFGKGHFRIEPSYLNWGQRVLWDWNEDLDEAFVPGHENNFSPHNVYWGKYYLIPPIGIVIHNHDFGGSQEGVTRSAMAEWHYLKDWMRLSSKRFEAGSADVQ
jgi:hypothetical protein